eukprot:4620798-Pleurochrysis_carterae.AAC.1
MSLPVAPLLLRILFNHTQYWQAPIGIARLDPSGLEQAAHLSPHSLHIFMWDWVSLLSDWRVISRGNAYLGEWVNCRA